MKKAVFMMATLLAVFCTSCKENNSEPLPDSGRMHFVHSVNVGDNTYVSLFKNLNVKQTQTANSQVFNKGAFSFAYKGKVYVSNTERLYKYTVVNGTLKQEGETMTFPSGALASFITFKSETKAYVSCIGLGKIIIINPSTMTKTGEIDLSSYSTGVANNDKNPEPGVAIIRDNILYVGLIQDKSKFNPEAGAYVAVIDTEKDKPIKMIKDDRATMASSYSTEGSFFIDEKGDIYLYCVGMFGYNPALNEGFLRIQKGQTEFDKSYYFPIKNIALEGTSGKNASYIYTKVYWKNGKVYGFLNIPGYASNPPDYVKDKSMQPFEIDVYNKTVKKMEFGRTPGWAASVGISGDDVIFGMASDQGTGYYVYNAQKNTYEPLKIKTEGAPYMISHLD